MNQRRRRLEAAIPPLRLAPPSERMAQGGRHQLLLCFEPDGAVAWYPTTDNPAVLASRLRTLVRMFLENPSAIRDAAGLHDDSAGGC